MTLEKFVMLACVALFVGAIFFVRGLGERTAAVDPVIVEAQFSALSKQFSPAPKGPDPAIVALANAARRYGVDPELLIAISRFETGTEFSPLVGPNCKNCSAQGMCQMIRSTRKSYGVERAKYKRYKSGPYISYLITEAKKQADACARFTRDQIVAIRRAVKRKPTAGEVYIAHLLGLGWGLKVIKARGHVSVTKVTSAAARRANRFIRKAKTAGGLRRAASVMIRNQMAKISVPSVEACRSGASGGVF